MATGAGDSERPPARRGFVRGADCSTARYSCRSTIACPGGSAVVPCYNRVAVPCVCHRGCWALHWRSCLPLLLAPRTGDIVDRNKNGQLDDAGATFDVGGGVYGAARVTAGSPLAPNTFLDLNGNGIADRCSEGLPQSISLKRRSSIPVTRNGRGTISPSCISEVPCGGFITIVARLDSSESALRTIARRRYLTCRQGPCGTQEQRNSDLKLTAASCKVLNRKRGKLQA